MADLKIVSREYKAMLKASRFAGDERRLLETAGRFWRDAGKAFADVVVDVGGNLSDIQAHRLIRFYDTPKRELNCSAYIFRERVELDGKRREVTLKFRHPDRYVAQDRDMRAAEGDDVRTKFEEDIKPSFQSLYSHSTTQRIETGKVLDAVKDVSRFYPGLKQDLPGLAKDTPIEVVDKFTARELVIGGAGLQLGKSRRIAAECVLVVWYDHAKPDKGDTPVVAEFSFKYGDGGEDYNGGAVRRAYEAFTLLQNGLPDWVDHASKTKTAFVYG